MNSQNNKFKKSLKEESLSQKKEFIEFYDTINKIYSNYKYNIGFKIPKKWSVDKGFSEHTILRTYDADSSNSFTINVIETKYDVEKDFWKIYDKNKDEFENKKYHWYNSWDVESLCIFDTKAFDNTVELSHVVF